MTAVDVWLLDELRWQLRYSEDWFFHDQLNADEYPESVDDAIHIRPWNEVLRVCQRLQQDPPA